MKKAKLMLVLLVGCSVLGATLAFKAKLVLVNWCSTTEFLINPYTTGCPLYLEDKRTVAGTVLLYATSRDVVGDAIQVASQCENPNLTCVKVRLTGDVE